jgi:hypothetical protein
VSTAALTKYAANSFLATKVALINEIADLAEKVGANVQQVARGIELDNRIGLKLLHLGYRLRQRGSENATALRSHSGSVIWTYRELTHRKKRAPLITYRHSESEQFENTDSPPSFVNEL